MLSIHHREKLARVALIWYALLGAFGVFGILFADLKVIVSPITNLLIGIGEAPFFLWLLIRGARNPARNEGSPRPA